MRDTKLGQIMTSNMVCSFPDMIMTEVSQIFDQHDFHHLPVIDKDGKCVGVISKSDYYQLQDQFTRSNKRSAEINNKLLFRSLLASEVMSKEPKSLRVDDTIGSAIEIFLENRVHSIVIEDEDKCKGIVTPYDILKLINQEAYV